MGCRACGSRPATARRCLFRQVDIDLAVYPTLAWRWHIELPIRSPLAERTREGDDHPARLFLPFASDHGERYRRILVTA
jgi:hypothetical protein